MTSASTSEGVVPTAGGDHGTEAAHVALADLARALHAKTRTGPLAVLNDAVAAALTLIPGATSAAVTTVKGRTIIETLAATDEHATQFDHLQQRSGQGPCLDAAAGQYTIEVSDLGTDDRWPTLAADAAAHSPIRAMVSYPLFTHTENLGVLTVYCTAPHAITDDALSVGYALAAHAALAYDAARRYEQFHRALTSRDSIGQAKGITMERFNIDAEAAFALLATLSQDTNVSVAQIAQQLAQSKPDSTT
ncbi:GAF and ANTAR domain-containing protein [Williamsia sp. DF01-3]|uniref:GAF and ANTAR domain-containing protein n=1 Tax=Williamsia sp. DF01-3 TaxID=2934157 RepID=UPI001FF6CCAC|nr:GAF and ANTAR domain-containing protein [Williamsia sp. DF01-3]